MDPIHACAVVDTKKGFVNVVGDVTNIHVIAAKNAVEIVSIVYAI